MSLIQQHPRTEIVGIQYLRGICAIAVVFAHCTTMAAFPKYFDQAWLGGAPRFGALGVDLFFGISGFIISIVCLSEGTLTPRTTIREFARRRFIRIIPMMWIAVFAYAALRIFGRGTFDIKPALLALLPIFPGEVAPNAVWTLRHELMFYFVFAVSFLGKRPHHYVLIIWGMLPVLIGFMGIGPNESNWWLRWLYEWSHPAHVEFMAGLGIGVLWLKRTTHWSFNLKPWEPFSMLVVLFLIYLCLGYSLDLGSDKIRSTLVSAVIICCVLFVAVHVQCPDGLIKRVGEFLGAASYSIYLFHLHVVSALLGVWSHVARETSLSIAIPCIAAVTVALCCGIHVIVERPLIRFVSKLLR